MTTKIETLRVGDKLYDVHREKAGNTTMSRESCWTITVVAVGSDERGAWAELSWNGNPPRGRTYGTTGYKRWPKEWLAADPWASGTRSGRWCAICYGREKYGGHKPTCPHPRAVAARKRAEANR